MPVVAYGIGLTKAVVGQTASFYVDTKGFRGNLKVQVDGELAPDRRSSSRSNLGPISGCNRDVSLLITPGKVLILGLLVKNLCK